MKVTPAAKTAEKPSRKRFIVPTPGEVREYGESIGFEIDGERFCDYYAAVGWVVGRGKPMKDWKAAVRLWRSNSMTTTAPTRKKPTCATCSDLGKVCDIASLPAEYTLAHIDAATRPCPDCRRPA